MSLTEEDKKRLEEEEAYREKVREGLGSPSKQNKPIWKKWWFWIILIFGSIYLYSRIPFAQELTRRAEEQAALEESPAPTSKNSQVSQYVFDIPSLVGKDLDGVMAVLGTPKGQDPTAQQIALGAKEWDKTFTKDGKELLVTYAISNRKIVDFFISADDPSGKTKNTAHLMGLGNLKQNDPRYKIEFVKVLKDPSSFTGVKVIPK